jgi:hypothetical protein
MDLVSYQVSSDLDTDLGWADEDSGLNGRVQGRKKWTSYLYSLLLALFPELVGIELFYSFVFVSRRQ